MTTPAPKPKRTLTRRKLLQYGLVGALTGGFAVYRAGFYARSAFYKLEQLTPTTGAILYAILPAMLPSTPKRTPEELREMVECADNYITGLPATDRRLLLMLLYAIEHSTLPLGWKLSRFTRLSIPHRRVVLKHWQTHPVGLVRLGFQNLKTIAFLVHYRDKKAFDSIHYTGPMVSKGYPGPPKSKARYDKLLAPKGKEPSF
ncbi:MAG TPA: hypothetical protein DCE42_01915 [Myxococcales bacterium]|mgnify:CR=1 FL=1|nr:hypothetical protein [Deltaproteobacteria bacterium]HAA53479.1 hypothetical protein [Myxococcales bacterium]